MGVKHGHNASRRIIGSTLSCSHPDKLVWEGWTSSTTGAKD
ncbi:MAG: hypothetical protein ACOYXA_18920 [Bacteroidota bacterium]